MESVLANNNYRITFYEDCSLLKALDNNYSWKDIENLKYHGYRVAETSVKIAQKLKLSKSEIFVIRLCALLHDVGKLSINADIINKKEKLTKKEYECIKSHVKYSKIYIENIGWPEYSNNVLYHHERVDGSGYFGLTDKEIPIVSKIIAIADVYDALNSNRPYRKAYRNEIALKIIEKERHKYDKGIYNTFIELYG